MDKKIVADMLVAKEVSPAWRKKCGYGRWGNTGPVERRSQLSAPKSVVKRFKDAIPEKQRRKAIAVALEWVVRNKYILDVA